MNENNLMLFLLLVVISFVFLSIFFIVTLVLTYTKLKRLHELENYPNDPTHFVQSLLLEILPSKSTKRERLSCGKNLQGPTLNGSGHQKVANEPEEQEKASKTGSGQVTMEEKKRVKKKKKGKKKKRVDLKGEEVVEGEENGGVREMGFLCPFTSMGSPTQRKIKELYHQLLQSCESKELTVTLAQVAWLRPKKS